MARTQWRWTSKLTLTTLASLAMILLAGGCASNSNPRVNNDLAGGYQALGLQQIDSALASADAYLARTPHGPASAEALYLRGRALAARVASNEAESKANLQAARVAYVQALQLEPRQPLEAYIRTSLANVAYFQDDYQTAYQQWSAAYERLENKDLQAWVLYKIGRSLQRLGQFDQADRTFIAVQKQYPGSTPAQLSREAQGQRQFYVQLATFNSASSAGRAADAVRRMGITPIVTSNSASQHILRIGPYASFQQANSVRSRFTSEYPDALINP
ncbi:MAG: SPOR domain-containing protein [Phycisphaerales bacterium]|nr:SPOR domain-containing protein [Phycisphaerales bacterium]